MRMTQDEAGDEAENEEESRSSFGKVSLTVEQRVCLSPVPFFRARLFLFLKCFGIREITCNLFLYSHTGQVAYISKLVLFIFVVCFMGGR